MTKEYNELCALYRTRKSIPLIKALTTDIDILNSEIFFRIADKITRPWRELIAKNYDVKQLLRRVKKHNLIERDHTGEHRQINLRFPDGLNAKSALQIQRLRYLQKNPIQKPPLTDQVVLAWIDRKFVPMRFGKTRPERLKLVPLIRAPKPPKIRSLSNPSLQEVVHAAAILGITPTHLLDPARPPNKSNTTFINHNNKNLNKRNRPGATSHDYDRFLAACVIVTERLSAKVDPRLSEPAVHAFYKPGHPNVASLLALCHLMSCNHVEFLEMVEKICAGRV